MKDKNQISSDCNSFLGIFQIALQSARALLNVTNQSRAIEIKLKSFFVEDKFTASENKDPYLIKFECGNEVVRYFFPLLTGTTCCSSICTILYFSRMKCVSVILEFQETRQFTITLTTILSLNFTNFLSISIDQQLQSYC
jgi:hypothetical protein